MAEFVLHGIPGSPHARAVLLTLEEKGADYRFAAMPFGGNRKPEYAAIHPFNKVPTLDHGDFRLYETHAILRYIDRAADGPALVPASPRGAARMDQLISFGGDYLTRRMTSVLVFNRCFRPALGLAPDEQAVADSIEPSREVLAELARLMDGAPFLAGDALSLADLMIAPPLSLMREFAEGRELLGERPALSDWLGRMEQRASMQGTTWDVLAAETGLNARLPLAPA